LEVKTDLSTQINREINLEKKLLKVRHMSRPEFFYIGLPDSVSKMGILKMSDPPP
jgi:hypothetical protein